MPIYEYRCGACGHELEVLQKLSDAPLADCPSCGQSRLSKLISAAGFQLKGTGWYATDFKNSGRPKPAAKKDGNGEAVAGTSTAGAESTAKSDSTASDSKSDAKSSSSSGGGCGPGCSCH